MEPIKLKESFEENDSNLKEQSENSGGVENGRENLSLGAENESDEKSNAEKDDAYAKIISKISDGQTSSSDDSIHVDAKDASMKTDAQSQIKHLLDVASVKGITHAVKVAKHMEDNYILDAFHDKLLSDELHDALVQRGMIEE